MSENPKQPGDTDDPLKGGFHGASSPADDPAVIRAKALAEKCERLVGEYWAEEDLDDESKPLLQERLQKLLTEEGFPVDEDPQDLEQIKMDLQSLSEEDFAQKYADRFRDPDVEDIDPDLALKETEELENLLSREEALDEAERARMEALRSKYNPQPGEEEDEFLCGVAGPTKAARLQEKFAEQRKKAEADKGQEESPYKTDNKSEIPEPPLLKKSESLGNRLSRGIRLGKGVYLQDGVMQVYGDIDAKKAKVIATYAARFGWQTIYALKKNGQESDSASAAKLQQVLLSETNKSWSYISALQNRLQQQGQPPLQVSFGTAPTKLRAKHKQKDKLGVKFRKWKSGLDGSAGYGVVSRAYSRKLDKAIQDNEKYSGLEYARMQEMQRQQAEAAAQRHDSAGHEAGSAGEEKKADKGFSENARDFGDPSGGMSGNTQSNDNGRNDQKADRTGPEAKPAG